MGTPIDAWSSMGYAARVILVVLIAFAAELFFIVAERFVTYRRLERASGGAHTGRPDLRRHLHLLAAIKVTAPMLGLLGTLLGTINGLAGMAMTGAFDPRTFGAGMAEALMMLVLGLVIGLPAWWAHSFYTAWAERLRAREA
jgi:biopolymer transport protein ExbB/TolQ